MHVFLCATQQFVITSLKISVVDVIV